MSLSELRFRAMGSDVHLLVTGGRPGLTGHAVQRIEDLEAAWSRFRPESEINRLNAAAGQPTVVSAETFLLISRAVHAWRESGGLFDPTVLEALKAAGYDRSFEQVASSPEPAVHPGPAPGCAGFLLDGESNTVTMPPKVGFDPGGIGKGLTADLICNELLYEGAAGACVNMGGDVRVSGEPPTETGWVVGISDPWVHEKEIAHVALLDGAVATSSRLMRAWTRGEAKAHHLIDPRTGEPAVTTLATVSVVSGEAWWAEVVAKCALIAGLDHGQALITRMSATGLLVDDDSTTYTMAGMEGLLSWLSSP